MATGQRASLISHRGGYEYWGKLKYFGGYSRHKQDKKLSHRINRAHEKIVFRNMIVNEGAQ